MNERESTWSDWQPEFPDVLQPSNRVAWFDDSLTTAPNPSTHFVVSKAGGKFRYFEAEWDSHTEQRRWREIDREECRNRTMHCAPLQPQWQNVFGDNGQAIDGPFAPNGFRWEGQEFRGLQPLPWRLVKFLWSKPGKSASFEDLAEPVWRDANILVDVTTFGNPRTLANNWLRKNRIPFTVASKGRIACLEESSAVEK